MLDTYVESQAVHLLFSVEQYVARLKICNIFNTNVLMVVAEPKLQTENKSARSMSTFVHRPVLTRSPIQGKQG